MSWTLALIASIILGVLSWLFFKKSKLKTSQKCLGSFDIYVDSLKGHTMSLAEILAKEAQKYNFIPHIMSIDYLQSQNFKKEYFCVVLCSTQTDENTSNFIQLVDKLPQNGTKDLSNLFYSIFSPENTPNCRKNIKQVLMRLENLKAIEFVKSISGSEKYFVVFQMWVSEILRVLSMKSSIPKNKPVKKNGYLEVALQVPLIKPNPKNQYVNPIKLHQENSDIKIVKIKKLNNDPDFTILNVEAIINYPYETAGILAIFPENPPDIVKKISELQNYDLNQTFRFTTSDNIIHPFPTPTTVFEALSKFCDLTSFLTKKTLIKLSHFSQTPQEQHEFLTYFSIEKNHDNTLKNHDFPTVTITELLQMFPYIRIPMKFFIQIIPRINPRFYFISSYNKYSPRKIQIAVQVQKKQNLDGEIRRKICSEYIESMFLNGVYKNVKGFCLPSKFKIPSVPCLVHMICNRCGVGAFKGLLLEIQEQAMLKNQYCQVILYLISKSTNRRFLYKQYIEMLIAPSYEKPLEFEHLPENYSDGPHIIKQMFLGSSKGQGHKNIIKDILYTRKVHLWESLNNDNAHIMVAGSESLGKSVKDFILNLAEDHIGNEGKNYIEELISKNKYIEEVWTDN